MKKVIFSAAAFGMVAVSGMTLAPTTSEAIPAFARQTGAACYSCHHQSFPAIKAFGRAFKMNSFTDVGDQALVEDDNLSIPAVLNATFVVKGNAQNVSVTPNTTPSATVYTIPTDAVLMLGGRIGTNTGAFIEFNGTAANWQLINSFDAGGFKVGIGAHNTGFGGSGVLELSNVFGQHGGVLFGKQLSAVENAGFTQGTTGIGAWVGNDMGVLQFALIAPSVATGGATNVGLKFGKLVRGIATLDLAGWDTLIGFGIVTGKAGKPVLGDNGAAAAEIPMDLQFIDVQLQGEVGDASIGVYADWAHAKGKTGANIPPAAANYYGGSANFTGAAYGIAGAVANGTGNKYDGYSIRATVEPVDHFLFLIGYGTHKVTTATGSQKENIFQLGGQYAIYQNMELKLVYQAIKDTTPLGVAAKANVTTLEVEALM